MLATAAPALHAIARPSPVAIAGLVVLVAVIIGWVVYQNQQEQEAEAHLARCEEALERMRATVDDLGVKVASRAEMTVISGDPAELLVQSIGQELPAPPCSLAETHVRDAVEEPGAVPTDRGIRDPGVEELTLRAREEQRERGIFLSVLGVGTGNVKGAPVERR